MEKVNMLEKFALFSDHFKPRVVGELNGQQVKLDRFDASESEVSKSRCRWKTLRRFVGLSYLDFGPLVDSY